MSSESVIGCVGLLLFAATILPAADKKEDLEPELALPQAISWVPPVYPKEAANKKLEERVQVRFIIDETGVVTKARALHPTNNVFEEAAVQSVLQWRFMPAMEDGRKVAKCMDVLVPFQLADPKREPASSFPPAKVIRSLAYSPYTRAAKVSGDDPEYPDSLLSRHLRGEVDVEFTVDNEGRRQAVKILWATHADFIRPALDAVDKWLFRPAQQGDLTVMATMQSALEFEVLDAKRVDMLAANGITVQSSAGNAFDTRPSLRIVVDPVYPYDLRLAGTEGDVVVDFVIGTNGRTESIAVREATRPEFGHALAAALECWLFNPAFNAGMAVAVKATARWHYSLASDSPEFQSTERLVQRLRRNDTADMGPKGLDGQLSPVHQIPPFYPASLLGEKPTGDAVIEFIIDRDGRCRLARIISATREEFGWAAATAVERWVFDPPRRGGCLTDVRVSIPFHFSAPL